MTGEETQVTPEYPGDPSSTPPPFSGRYYLLSLIAVSAITAAVVLVACGGRSNDSPTAPSGVSTTPTTPTTWPAVPAPFGGLSISHPPELKPTVLSDFKIAFSEEAIPPDTDALAEIAFSSYLGTAAEHRSDILRDLDMIETNGLETLGSVEVFHIVGRLKPDVFGWGGTVHGYFVFQWGGETVVVDYVAEDPRIAQLASEMVRRTLLRP